MVKYRPKDATNSPRYCGIRTFMNLMNVRTLEDVDFIVAGVPYDTACTTRVGARYGPEAVRSASILQRPYNPDMNINLFEYLSGVDYGDLDIVPDDIEQSYSMIEKEAIKIFAAEVNPVFIGGDHSVTLPLLRAASKVYGKIALVHFDSHSDTDDQLWGRKFVHATPMRRAAEEGCLEMTKSIQVGLRGPTYAEEGLTIAEGLGFELLTRKKIREIGIDNASACIRNRVKEADAVYITFDIDFLDPAYAPGTGTPEVGGFTTWEAIELIRKSLDGLNLVGMDLVEVNPAYDSPGQITSYAAASIMYEYLTLLARNKRNGRMPKKS